MFILQFFNIDSVTIVFSTLFAQLIYIRKEKKRIKTYPFSDPNPVPVPGIKKKFLLFIHIVYRVI